MLGLVLLPLVAAESAAGLAPASTASPRPRTTAPPACETIVRACMLSDRLDRMAAVMQSAMDAATAGTCIEWTLFTSDAAHIERLEALLDELDVALRASPPAAADPPEGIEDGRAHQPAAAAPVVSEGGDFTQGYGL